MEGMFIDGQIYVCTCTYTTEFFSTEGNEDISGEELEGGFEEEADNVCFRECEVASSEETDEEFEDTDTVTARASSDGMLYCAVILV